MRSTAMRWNFREYRFLLSTGVSSPGECAHRECANSRGHSKFKDAGTEKPAHSSLSIPAISHFRKSSRQDPTVTALRAGFPERRLARDCHFSEYRRIRELGKDDVCGSGILF